MKIVLWGLLQGLGGWLLAVAAMSWLLQALTGAPATSTLGVRGDDGPTQGRWSTGA